MIMETELFGKKPYHCKKKKCAHTEKKEHRKNNEKKNKRKEKKIKYQYSISFKTLYCNLTAIYDS